MHKFKAGPCSCSYALLIPKPVSIKYLCCIYQQDMLQINFLSKIFRFRELYKRKNRFLMQFE
jgi:hypothetical protein